MFNSIKIKKGGVLSKNVRIKKKKLNINQDNYDSDANNANTTNTSETTDSTQSNESKDKAKSSKIIFRKKKKEKKHYTLQKNSVVILELDMVDDLESIFKTSSGTFNTHNGKYKSYKIDTMVNVKGTARVESNPTKDSAAKVLRTFNPKLINETYDKYLSVMKTLNMNKNAGWLFEILDGNKEQEKIVKRCDDFIIVIDWKCSPNDDGKYDPEKIHLLVVPYEKIKSIRDLDSSHVGLLENMMEQTYEVLKTEFDMDEEHVRMFYHYPPSTYQLHMHAQWIGNSGSSDFVRAKDAHDVIKNISYDDNYYKGDMKYYRS